MRVPRDDEVEVKRTPSVHVHLERVTKAAGELSHLVSTLEDRLGFVLGPPRPVGVNDADRERAASSTLAAVLEDHAEHLSATSRRVEGLLARLEV